MKAFLSLLIALFFASCASQGLMQTAITTNNEGIFIKAKKNESFKIIFHNASSTQSKLALKLSQSLQNLGLKEVEENPSYEIYSTTSTLKNALTLKELALQPTFSLILTPLKAKENG